MSCVVEKRNRLRRAAEALDAMPNVVGVDVLAPDVSESGAHELEIVVATATVGPLLLDVLSARRLRVVDLSRRGDPGHCIVRTRA